MTLSKTLALEIFHETVGSDDDSHCMDVDIAVRLIEEAFHEWYLKEHEGTIKRALQHFADTEGIGRGHDGDVPIGRNTKANIEIGFAYRHVKSITEYIVLGTGRMQAEDWHHIDEYGDVGDSIDMMEVVIYRSLDDGRIWVRPIEEFLDGRFEKVSAA